MPSGFHHSKADLYTPTQPDSDGGDRSATDLPRAHKPPAWPQRHNWTGTTTARPGSSGAPPPSPVPCGDEELSHQTFNQPSFEADHHERLQAPQIGGSGQCQQGPDRSQRLQAQATRSGRRATHVAAAAARLPKDPGVTAPASSSAGGPCRPRPPRHSSRSSRHAGGGGPRRPSCARRRRAHRRRLPHRLSPVASPGSVL
jgi:hypothetical protein